MLFEIAVAVAYGGFAVFCFGLRGMWPAGVASLVAGALSVWAVWHGLHRSGDFGLTMFVSALTGAMVLSVPVLVVAIWCAARRRGN